MPTASNSLIGTSPSTTTVPSLRWLIGGASMSSSFLQLADDLLEDVLHRHQATRPAVLVHDDGDRDVRSLEVLEHVADGSVFGHEEHIASQCGNAARWQPITHEHVFHVDVAGDLVRVVVLDDGHAGEAVDPQGLHDRVGRIVEGDGFHVRRGGP